MIVGPSPKGPTVFPVGLTNRQIVDRSEPPLRFAGGIEFPVFVAVRAEPVAAVVMPFISKAHGDPVVAKRPYFLDQAVIQFLGPFAGEKGDDLGAPVDELRPVSPAAVLSVGERDPMRVAAVPRVLRQTDLEDTLSRVNGGTGAGIGYLPGFRPVTASDPGR